MTRSTTTLTMALAVLLAAAGLTLGCGGDDDAAGWDPASDGDTDIDSDSDSDSDSDGDSDGDGDVVPDDEPEQDTDTETEECDTENEVVLYLSADDSNSMASPVLARRQILNGALVGTSIRTYEFLNYYTFGYEPADPGTVSVTAQMRPNEEGTEDYDTTYNLQIGVTSQTVTAAERRPVNITLSLDTSGSMGGASISLVRDCCLAIASSLADGDIVSMVTWDTSQSILLDSHEVSGPDDSALVAECNGLSAGGGTDLHSGLVTAYQLANENFSEDRINRVILMSDGGANVGITDEQLIAENADDSEGEGIYMMGVGVGDTGYFNEVLMDTITDAGKGAYVFVDTPEEAQKMFGDRFLSNVEIAAKDVRVELTLPPSFEMVEFHGEEVSENPDEVEPQHLAPNDSMIYHQVVGSCDPTVVNLDDEVHVEAEFYEPLTLEPLTATFDTTLGDLFSAGNALLLKGDAVVAYAEALKSLKSLTGTEALDLIDTTLARVVAAKNALADDPDLAEIESLLTTYRDLFD